MYDKRYLQIRNPAYFGSKLEKQEIHLNNWRKLCAKMMQNDNQLSITPLHSLRFRLDFFSSNAFG